MLDAVGDQVIYIGDIAKAALASFNDLIISLAVEHRVPILDLRLVCSERTDYANEIEPHTRKGQLFDLVLIGAIVLSVVTVVLTSIAPVAKEYGQWLFVSEWVFTLLFTAEYVLRLWCVHRPTRYARSAFGVIDVLGASLDDPAPGRLGQR